MLPAATAPEAGGPPADPRVPRVGGAPVGGLGVLAALLVAAGALLRCRQPVPQLPVSAGAAASTGG